MEKKFSPHLSLAQEYWERLLHSSDVAIDATCGNGHDTLFLADLCCVVGLDIQQAAIDKTANRVQGRATLHYRSHAEIDAVPLPRPPKLIVYNLGYLPHGDKSITTRTETTLMSVNKALALLAPQGALSITCYPGHDEGQREEHALMQWALELPKDLWRVTHHRWLERERAPSLLWICSMM